MLTGILAGLAAGALWGLVFVAPRVLQGFAAVDVTVGRFLVYGVFSLFMLAMGWRSRPRPTGRQMLAAFGFSVLGFTGYYWLLAQAVLDMGPELPTLVIGTIPIWVMLLGKPDHLRWAELLPGLLLTMAGLGLMLHAQQGEQAAVHPHMLRGMLLALASMLCWTAYAVWNSAWLKRHPEVGARDWTNWLGVCAGVGAMAISLFTGSMPKVLLGQETSALAAIVLIAMGVGSGWLGTTCWNLASQRLSASLCGQLIVSETLFALLYAFVWDGQWPSPQQWLAVVLFTLGILASIHAHR